MTAASDDVGRARMDTWTRPTTDFWQHFEPLADWANRLAPPYRHGFPILLKGERVFVLPIRRLPGSPDTAVASLIANQASLPVVDRLGALMGQIAQSFHADVVVGLPTLGISFAPAVAKALGHTRWVPMVYSRKFWYDEALSTSVRSVTTPGPGKTIYLDPSPLPLVEGRRVVIVDDVVSTARTLAQIWELLDRLGAVVVGSVVAMRQGTAWRQALGRGRTDLVAGVFDTPRLRLCADGWWPE